MKQSQLNRAIAEATGESVSAFAITDSRSTVPSTYAHFTTTTWTSDQMSLTGTKSIPSTTLPEFGASMMQWPWHKPRKLKPDTAERPACFRHSPIRVHAKGTREHKRNRPRRRILPLLIQPKGNPNENPLDK